VVKSDGVLITDGRSSVFIHPPQPYPDNVGYHHQVDLVGGPFRGSINASCYENVIALRHFSSQVVTLYRNLKGEAVLSNAYDNFKLSLKGDGLGHVEVQVLAAAGGLLDCHLSFRFSIDQTQLPAIVAALEQSVSSS